MCFLYSIHNLSKFTQIIVKLPKCIIIHNECNIQCQGAVALRKNLQDMVEFIIKHPYPVETFLNATAPLTLIKM